MKPDPKAGQARWLRYARWIDRHAGRVIAGFGALSLACGILCYTLHLQDDLTDLLPASARSVEDLRRVQSKVGGANLSIAVQSPSLKDNERYVEALVARLRERMSAEITFIDYDVRVLTRFYEQNGVLYAGLDDLRDIERRLRAEIDRRKAEHNPFFIDLPSDPPPAAAPAPGAPAAPAAKPDAFAEAEERLDRLRKEHVRPYPDSYFATDDGTLLVIFVRPSRAGSAMGPRKFIAKIQQLADELAPKSYHPQMKVEFAGEMQIGVVEYESIKRDITSTAGLCVVLVALLVLLYFRRLRVLALLVTPLIVGTLVAFAIARLLFGGAVNVQTAFLGSIIIGTGINYGIILLARYLEERLDGRDAIDALGIAIAATFAPTLAAAAATAVSFGALYFGRITTFHQFGIVGGVGIFLCWVLSYTLLPAITLSLERVRPTTRARFHEWRYPRLLALLPVRGAKLAVAVAAVLTAVSLWQVWRFLPDCLETDLSNLRNEAMDGTYVQELDARISTIFTRSMTPMYMLARDREQSRRICEYFNGMVDRLGVAAAPIHKCHSIYELLPSEMPAKLEVMASLRKLLDEVPPDEVPERSRAFVADLRKKLAVRPFGIDELPEPLRRTFTTSDGVVGAFAAIEPPHGRDLWISKNLFAFTDAVRSVDIGGERLTTSGSAVVFADILRTIAHDGPIAIAIAASGVLLVVFVGLGSLRGALWVGVPLCIGVIWMAGVDAILHVRINFMNFIAVPTTFGIGVDYVVNVWQRSREESPDDDGLVRTLQRTGGAVVLCSATTTVGYYTLVIAKNLALVSLGKLAMIGEFTCLAAAMLLLPALLRLARRRAAIAPPDPGAR